MSVELREKLFEKPITFGVMGPIGAGKSSISKVLAERMGIPVVEENYSQNPFLENFYANPKEWSYKSQTWFLTEKVKQLKEVDFTKSLIIDPALEMDFLYAQTLQRIGFMEEREFDQYKNTYESIYRILIDEKKIKKPDIFLVVTAPTSVLEKRIRGRGRKFELVMLRKYPSYLANLKRSVDAFKGNLIYVNSEEDTFTDKENINDLMDEINMCL